MGTAAPASRSHTSVESLLGGRAVLHTKPRSPLEWVAVIRGGLPASAVGSLTSVLGVTQSELAASVGISERTLVRRNQQGTLNSDESAKMVRLARAVERAAEVFEGLDPALDWLKTPNAALGAVTPLSLFDTDIGAETVLDTLGRVKHGVVG
ncbi:MAG: type II RES/Xre toxin-antitoxin system antitoxin [Thermoleophilia bacterium]